MKKRICIIFAQCKCEQIWSKAVGKCHICTRFATFAPHLLLAFGVRDVGEGENGGTLPVTGQILPVTGLENKVVNSGIVDNLACE